MASIIYPTNDYAFHRIFGDEKHSEVIISFLNAVLQFPPEHTITQIRHMLEDQAPKIAGLKGTTLDIYVTDKSGRHFLVEMQVQHSKYFADRVLYYASRAVANQLKEGEDYDMLKPVYFIGVLKDFTISSGQNYLSCHTINDRLTGEQVLKKMTFYFIELKKFHKDDPTRLEGILEKWLFFLKYGSSNMTAEVIRHLPEAELGKAIDITRFIAQDEKSLLRYQQIEDLIRDSRTRDLENLERGREEGRAEGREEGLEEGEAIGIQKGEAIGMHKGIHKVAREMKQKGLAVELIQELTGLSVEEIEEL